jgi:hypothetical protein
MQHKNPVRSGSTQKNHGNKQTAAANRAKQQEAKRAAERQVIIDQKEAASAKRAAESVVKKTNLNATPVRKVQTPRLDKAAQARTVEASTRNLQRLTPQINLIAAATSRSMQPA